MTAYAPQPCDSIRTQGTTWPLHTPLLTPNALYAKTAREQKLLTPAYTGSSIGGTDRTGPRWERGGTTKRQATAFDPCRRRARVEGPEPVRAVRKIASEKLGAVQMGGACWFARKPLGLRSWSSPVWSEAKSWCPDPGRYCGRTSCRLLIGRWGIEAV